MYESGSVEGVHRLCCERCALLFCLSCLIVMCVAAAVASVKLLNGAAALLI